MKNLLLMRHAKSSWKDLTLNDHQRPLNKRGKRDAPRIGKYLREQGVIVDAILCSTAVRARETVKCFLKEFTFEGEVFYVDDLYHANHETYIALLNQLPDTADTVMIVGHNPEMDTFLEMACDEYEHMPTGAVAIVQFPFERWPELSEVMPGKLVDLWKPREI
jgi:phosphohistidine phosphatase